MKIFLAILAIIMCLLASFRHQAVLNFAERNVPSYMREKTGVYILAILAIATVSISFISLFSLAWYWSILIAIPAAIILHFLFYLLMELITHANYTYVNGRSAISIWLPLIAGFILSVFSLFV